MCGWPFSKVCMFEKTSCQNSSSIALSQQGLMKNEGKALYGEAYKTWQKDPANFQIDGHYPVRELWERALSCWSDILNSEGTSILVVAHNAVNQALVATATGLCCWKGHLYTTTVPVVDGCSLLCLVSFLGVRCIDDNHDYNHSYLPNCVRCSRGWLQ